MDQKQIIVRFPPSPTGLLHIGSVRTALYNYLFAKQNDGKFILRIEDTDKERSRKEFEHDIYESLSWLGLNFDNKKEVWKQSERTETYKTKIQELIKRGAAYVSQETEGENKEVIRFKNPGGKIKFEDLIRGKIEIDVTDLNDFIIARNIDDPLYHLVVAVDDLESGVTHVVRGEDGISNTPRQILIIEALGGTRPIYAHLPLVLAPDKSKLSKRKHGESVSLKYYKDKGYSKEAILNFVALIGWNPGTDQEIFDLEDLVKVFDLSKVQKKGGVLNIQKLDWINREHILKSSTEIKLEKFIEQINKTSLKDNSKFNDQKFVQNFMDVFLERIHRWKEVGESIENKEYDYLFEEPKVDIPQLSWKGEGLDKTKENLLKILFILENKMEDRIKENIMQLAEEIGKGSVLWPLRFLLSNKEKSPDPFVIINLIGIGETKKRIKKIIEQI